MEVLKFSGEGYEISVLFIYARYAGYVGDEGVCKYGGVLAG